MTTLRAVIPGRCAAPPARSGFEGGLAAIALLVACGTPPVQAPAWTVAEPAAPDAVAMACAPGWAERAMGPDVVCEPWAARPACGAAELLVPGMGCVPLACPGNVPLAAGEVRVDASAAPGGDGSAARPFATLAEALAAGATTIRLAPGDHAGPGAMARVRVVGDCAATTRIVLRGGLVLTDAGLSDVTVTGQNGYLSVPPGARLDLERVVFSNVVQALEVEGSLVARDIVMRDLSVGIAALDPPVFELHRATLERVASLPVYVERTAGRPGSAVAIEDLVVVDSGDDPTGGTVQLDVGTGTMSRVVVEGGVGHGVLARSEGLTLEHVRTRDTGGAGVALLGSATLHAVLASAGQGGLVLGDGTFGVEDVMVEGARSVGISVESAQLDLSRVAIRGASQNGVAIGGTRGHVADVSVEDVAFDAAHPGSGGGISIERGCDVDLTRAAVHRTESLGLLVWESTARASDVRVEDVSGSRSGIAYGIGGVVGAQLTLERAHVARVGTVGITLEDSSGTLRDLSIESVVAVDGISGLGLYVAGVDADVTATVERAIVTDTVHWGVLATNRASLDARQIRVERVAVAPCVTTICPDTGGGAAYVVYMGASLALTDFEAREAAYAGLIAGEGVRARLERGTISGNQVGLVVSPTLPRNLGAVPGLDLVDVVLTNNVRDTDATEVVIEAPTLMVPR